MKLNKIILPVACVLLAGNVSMAQVIMPWENRTETDGIKNNAKILPPI